MRHNPKSWLITYDCVVISLGFVFIQCTNVEYYMFCVLCHTICFCSISKMYQFKEKGKAMIIQKSLLVAVVLLSKGLTC